MPNLANINITITATDNTSAGVGSAMSSLSRLGGSFGSIGSIAAGVFGGILGVGTFRAITSGFGSIVSSAFNLNNRLAESRAASASMVEAIKESEPVGTAAFGALQKAAQQYERTMREIREKESDGMADYAEKIDDVKQKILAAQQEAAAASARRVAQEKQQLEDLARTHEETITDLNTSIENENDDFNERLYDMNNSRQDKLDNLEESHADNVEKLNRDLIDAQEELLTASTTFDEQRAQAKIDSLNSQLSEEDSMYETEKAKINERADHEVQVTTDKHNREISSLQLRIERENAEYDRRKARIEQDAKDDIATAQKTADQKVTTLQNQLAREQVMHERFLRDIRQAYEDAGQKMEDALSGGGGGAGGTRSLRLNFDFGDAFRKMSGGEIDKFLDDVQKKYVEIGVKSPFNVGDIQNFGKAIIGYTGGSVTNMEKFVNMAQALAARNPVQGMLGATTAMVELLGSGNITSLARRFDIPKANLAGLSEAKNEAELADLLNEALSRSGITMGLVEAKTHTFGGALENLKETFNLVAAAMTQPIWQVFTDKLVALNKWLFDNQGTLTALTNTVGGFITSAIQPLVNIFNTGLQPALDLIGFLWRVLSQIWDEVVGPALGRIFTSLSQLWIEIAPEIQKTLKFMQTWWTNHADEVIATVKFIASVLEFTFRFFIDTIKMIIKVGLALIRGDWESVFNAIEKFGKDMFNNFSDFVKNIWDAIGTHIRNGINDVIDKINGFTSNLNKIKAKVGNIELGFSIPNIPHLAKGGIVTSPTLALIGEAGPEAVVPLGKGGGMGNVYVTVTGNNILDDGTAEVLAEKVGKAFVTQLQLQGRYT